MLDCAKKISKDDKLEDIILDVINDYCRYDKHNITNEGWKYLENVLPEELKEVFSDDEELPTREEVYDALYDLVSEYEQSHANIRYYSADDF